MALQKGETKKKKKKGSNIDTLQEQKKNKKEMEFELKLAKEKEEMHEREKQLKINRLVQEVKSVLCFQMKLITALWCPMRSFFYCSNQSSCRSTVHLDNLRD